ncbi:MAG: class I SAM-dependent methyltransferase [Bryobacteraceae bacterium]
MITSDQERAYFDRQYAQFLALPDHALRVDRTLLEQSIQDPSQPFYERRALYLATLRALEEEPLIGASVLDYGCGPADFGLWMACRGAEVTLLDLSPAAIELGERRAKASGLSIRGVAADASSLNMLRDEEFDLVFACAALHHTLKYPGAVDELVRIMRPGARLVLCETWGGNPLLNFARRLHWKLTGAGEDDGEDILMSRDQLALLEPYFRDITVQPMNFFAMGKRLLRGRFTQPWARAAVRMMEGLDAVVLGALPPLRHWCGEAVITARRKR